MRRPYAIENIKCARGLRTRLLGSLCLGMVFGIGCTPLAALDPHRAITQLAHRSWGAKEGAPAMPRALAQSRDGFLWLGTYQGLYRFDGVRFELYEPVSGGTFPSKKVRSLLALPNGELWIGFAEGSISVLKDGRVKTYGEKEGVPKGLVNTMAQDHQGRLWAATGHGLMRFNGRVWELVAEPWNRPENAAETVFVDSRGTVWVGTGSTVMYLPEGLKRFVPTGEYALKIYQMVEAPDGKVWMADAEQAVRPIGMPGSRRATIARCEAALARKGNIDGSHVCNSAEVLEIQVGSAGLLFDRQGSLWVTTVGDGLRRAPYPGQLKDHRITEFDESVEIFTWKDGLSADYDMPILEDREGSIWVGTREGLDQFRDTTLVPVVSPSRTRDITIAPDKGGYVWVSSNFNNIARIHGESLTVARIPGESMNVPRDGHMIYQIYRDNDGTTWSEGSQDLLRLDHGKFRKVTKIASAVTGTVLPKAGVQIVGDHSATLWAFVEGRGFFSLDKNRWKQFKTPPDVSKLIPNTSYTDSTGRIWIGTSDGVLISKHDGRIDTYPGADLRVGIINAIYEFAGHIWVGGSLGLALLDGQHFRSIRQPDLGTFTSVSGVVGTASSGLWLSESRGIIHIPREQIDQCVHSTSCQVQYELLDSADGLPGALSQSRINPTSIVGTDGRLWFVTIRGLAWVDPAHIARNDIPPPVSIMSVTADGSSYSSFENLRLPPHTANIHINYTALSLAVPERVRFRYMLDHIDRQWQESDTRRDALYSRLPPGRYHFRVIACNNDGLWNEAGAGIDFAVAPAFYQTVWFEMLCAVALASLAWCAYAVRLRQVTMHIQERLGARLEERERIARELHDTLLQGFQGLMLRFQAVMKTLPADQPAHRMMEQVLDRADEVLLEGRQSVKDLREKGAAGTELPDALLHCGEELALGNSSRFGMAVIGEPRPIEPVVFDESYRIAREALINAFQHSKAKKIEVELTYGESGLCIRVRDDGIGIDADILYRGRDGHWGFAGMRERADKIGAQLDIWSSLGAGAEVALTIPAKVAYSDSHPKSRWERIKRVVSGRKEATSR